MVNTHQQSKLIWQCRRGMLELDLILDRFVKQNIKDLNQTLLDHLEALLQLPDPLLYAWLVKSEQVSNPELKQIVTLILDHT